MEKQNNFDEIRKKMEDFLTKDHYLNTPNQHTKFWKSVADEHVKRIDRNKNIR
ncbi:hypothetical protein NBO_41g0012 [Nosema bombycis CQ1]|jgi:hypothetical protein|uniref:Uncharacterized protein n=1 Tax=Nosema bombycis (strain CQ1 / CVCC 102059) TaxID=578461 RepID=R0KTA3_NOSB1|nr:hypothetical protein NBO_41g0012 [Nosema bombycis CQ1]|eukprot:EOB14036.1 hypothetical protein NBO_41g0012 [Nosema bombycis CQ1]